MRLVGRRRAPLTGTGVCRVREQSFAPQSVGPGPRLKRLCACVCPIDRPAAPAGVIGVVRRKRHEAVSAPGRWLPCPRLLRLLRGRDDVGAGAGPTTLKQHFQLVILVVTLGLIFVDVVLVVVEVAAWSSSKGRRGGRGGR